MTDLALFVPFDISGADLLLEKGDIALSEGLDAAIMISLFTDRRAKPDDALPEGFERRGWWGDGFGVQNDEIGSRLWLLNRSKITSETLSKARSYAAEALEWLTIDGVASSVNIIAERYNNSGVALQIEIKRPDGTIHKFDHIWKAIGI